MLALDLEERWIGISGSLEGHWRKHILGQKIFKKLKKCKNLLY